MKMKCKYEQKANLGEKYIKCGRDGSICHYPCHCNKHQPTLWEKLKRSLACDEGIK